MSEELKFSIVICTYNRDEFLERTLLSLNNLSYSNFEVIVVNGPSTDRTSEIIEGYRDRIKIRTNSKANLSVSRNIGIKAAAGDVVAFLDDDAIPEPNWLHQIKEVYDAHSPIGGAGGRVFGPGGDHFQFHNGYIDIWGEAEVKLDQPGIHTAPRSDKYNIMMGVNSTFSRQALLEVGGFDEYYEYFHDESDLCVRLTKAGYPIYHHQEAYVHHEFARSHIRKSNYDMNWYPIVKNTVYFGVKNSKGIKGWPLRMIKPFHVANKRAREFKHWYRNRLISKKDYRRFMKLWRKGVFSGYKDGLFKSTQINNHLQNDDPFLTFSKVPVELDAALLIHQNNHIAETSSEALAVLPEKFGICLLSKYYPPFGSGGVATYTKVLAETLVKLGHPVIVLTSNVPEGKQNINGVSVEQVVTSTNSTDDLSFLNSVMPITESNVRYSINVANRVEELYRNGEIHLVETPLWDYEGLACTEINGLKTIVRLETPLRKAADMQGWKWNKDLELSANLEAKLLSKSDGIITISNNVKDTIAEMYGIEWGIKPELVPLGLFNRTETIENLHKASHSSLEINPIKVLFVGRLEPRKGVDILLNAFRLCYNDSLPIELILAGNKKIPFKNGLTMEEIFTRSSDKKIQEKVKFLGEVSDEELHQLYTKCDIFVAPSRYESFGLVYLEAMKYEKPVIGCAVGGVPEIIEDGVNGLLVKSEDATELAQVIIKLAKNKEERDRMGRKGREILESKFSTIAMTRKTLDYYLQVLNRNGK
ncbi:glycosyltransferase [Cohnella thailandensis]|uniref:Glycosyltransferase n=1 Tax=Cohnella thailandensis TaxID=557557 RepID=A0A841TA99_9BACL|nr:glycosyltransferase [Cohnella thailandensis]MBB6638141.1 glycosyltransferase [Cohnella thailandensis]MBP1971932.1 glycosyltransferase involved in cell wall biosynthesis [Cohnella thailandensis]